MIVRMEEARASDRLLHEFRRYVTGTLWPRLQATEGFLGGEVYQSFDGEPRMVLVSRWRDESALAAAAGEGWREAPFVRAEETAALARPPHVWHFAQLSP